MVIGAEPAAIRHNPMARCSLISLWGDNRWPGRTSSAGSNAGRPTSGRPISRSKNVPVSSARTSAR
jgi:hypothetical protein